MMSAFFLSSISAVEVNLNLLAIRSSETNIFSDPLPQNGSNDFLKGVVEKPYLDRTDYGIKADADFFFIPESRTGRAALSVPPPGAIRLPGPLP